MTGEFDTRILVFTGDVADLKIDWESCVGWSEMTWQDFRSAKPETGKLFRVILSPVDYYNFDFLDESKWQSYRLVSPDQKHSIYGYVPKDSELARRIRPGVDITSTELTLMLKFPKGTASNDQVEIESLVTEGWVEEDNK